MFANLAPKPKPIMETLGELAERFKSYRFEEMRVARKAVNRLEANWKLWPENSREGYHAPVVHAKSYRQFYQNRKSRGWTHSGKPGIDEIVSSSNDDGLLLPRNPPFEYVDGLSEEDRDTTHFVHYPHLLLNIAPSHLHFHQMFPEGPDATTVVTWFCFPKKTVGRPDFHKEVPRYFDPGSAMIEDKEICAKTQEGLRGVLSRSGRFAVLEKPAPTSLPIGCLILYSTKRLCGDGDRLALYRLECQLPRLNAQPDLRGAVSDLCIGTRIQFRHRRFFSGPLETISAQRLILLVSKS